MSEINDFANEIKRKMGQQTQPKSPLKETPIVTEVKPVVVSPPKVNTNPIIQPPINKPKQQSEPLQEIPFPTFQNQNINVEKPEFNDLDVEKLPPEEKKKFDQMLDDTNSYQLLILSILLAYVGVHGTEQERDHLLWCVYMIYKFDGYNKYMDKAVAIMMKYKDEEVSVFNIFEEIPNINQDLVNAEVEKRRREIDNLNKGE